MYSSICYISLLLQHVCVFLSSGQRVGVCNTSGSGTDLPGRSCDVAETHGPLPQNASLFMGFAFMLTASSESDRLTNKITSDEEEGEADGDEMSMIVHATFQRLEIDRYFSLSQQIMCRPVHITKSTQSPSCRQVEASSCPTSMKNRLVL